MALNTGMACSDRTFDRVSTLRISWSELAWLSHLFLLRSWLPASLLSPVLPTSQSLSEGCVAPAPAGWSACPLRNGGQSPCQKLLRDTSQGTQGLKASPVQWCLPLANAGPQKWGWGLVFRDNFSGWFLLGSALHTRATVVTVGPGVPSHCPSF